VTGSNVAQNSEEERSRLERQLAQSQKMEAIGKLAGGIAHDFNNLLTAIAGYSELLIESLPAEDPRRSHALEIQKAGERAASLTRQLLAFSRQQMLEPRVLDLNAVIESMEKMLERVIGEHIRIQTRKAHDLGHVRADPGQIEQAILNLVVNARDAMPSGGTLAITTEAVEIDGLPTRMSFPMLPGAYSVVAISDTGGGISANDKARLFEPFFTTKEQGKGTGLGLSTTYGIVKQSGGYIWCDSEPGRGSTFRIFLPRVEQPLPAADPEPAPQKSRPNNEKILLVEDEPEVRRLVEKVLGLQGYDVVAAGTPAEALEIERGLDQELDLLITDIVMPGMSGRELARRLAPLRPRMKILFVSGYTDDAVVQEGALEPGTDFLQKPFSPAALGRKIREILDARRGLQPGA
jgi:two-component system, cell cycle sensor histidine kinase and response regulator CckA